MVHAGCGPGCREMKLPRLDWKRLAGEAACWERNIARRGAPISAPDFRRLLAMCGEYRLLDAALQETNRQRNRVAMSASGPAPAGRALKDSASECEARMGVLRGEIAALSELVPNDTHPLVPDADVCVLEFNRERSGGRGEDHVRVLEDKGWMSMKEGAEIAGRGFTVLKRQGALLERALVNYALRYAISKGFTLVSVPDIVHERMIGAAGFAPRNGTGSRDEQVYRVAEEDLALAGTAEIPLLGMLANTRHLHLPQLFVAVGNAYRKEAGQYGAASRGLYRLHQFTKVELFALSRPEGSDGLFEDLCATQLELIRSLGFYGRQMEMGAKELGASAYRKRDIELWLPHSRRFGEVTSASLCTDYQTRRADIRGTDGTFLHTINATAVAVPRIIQCIAEHGLDLNLLPAVLCDDLLHLNPGGGYRRDGDGTRQHASKATENGC